MARSAMSPFQKKNPKVERKKGRVLVIYQSLIEFISCLVRFLRRIIQEKVFIFMYDKSH